MRTAVLCGGGGSAAQLSLSSDSVVQTSSCEVHVMSKIRAPSKVLVTLNCVELCSVQQGFSKKHVFLSSLEKISSFCNFSCRFLNHNYVFQFGFYIIVIMY